MIRIEALTEAHQTASFRSGNSAIDTYLIRDALREQNEEKTRVFVAVDTAGDITLPIGYFALILTGYYIPCIDETRLPHADDEMYLHLVELTFLARSQSWRGRGLGDFLMIEALRRVAAVSQYVGGPGVVLRTSREGRTLYERFECIEIDPAENYLFLPIADVRRMMA